MTGFSRFLIYQGPIYMRLNSVVWILRTYYLSIHSVKMLQEAAADSFLDLFRSVEDIATLHYEYLIMIATKF